MGELITAAQMAAIREIPLAGMQTPVSILRLTSTANPDGDDTQVWAETESTIGWIYEPLDYPKGDAVGGIQGVANEFRAYLPVETEVEAGDRLGVDGEIYNVVNTNDADTYQPMRRAALRKVE